MKGSITYKLLQDIADGCIVDGETWADAVESVIGHQPVRLFVAKMFGGTLSWRTVNRWIYGKQAPKSWRQRVIMTEMLNVKKGVIAPAGSYRLQVLKGIWQASVDDTTLSKLLHLGVAHACALKWIANMPDAWCVRGLILVLSEIRLEKEKRAEKTEHDAFAVESAAKSTDLTVKEHEILSMFYGFGGTKLKTVTQISKELGCSKQCVSDTRRRALAKIEAAKMDSIQLEWDRA